MPCCIGRHAKVSGCTVRSGVQDWLYLWVLWWGNDESRFGKIWGGEWRSRRHRVSCCGDAVRHQPRNYGRFFFFF